ncbi:TPA: hypothetical protein ACNH0U_000320 [Proteus mirabilis]
MDRYEGECFFFQGSEIIKLFDINVLENKIAFSFRYSQKRLYTVSMSLVSGILYKGRAKEKFTGIEIPVTGRVLRDVDAGFIMISGSEWQEKSRNYRWSAEIEDME